MGDNPDKSRRNLNNGTKRDFRRRLVQPSRRAT